MKYECYLRGLAVGSSGLFQLWMFGNCECFTTELELCFWLALTTHTVTESFGLFHAKPLCVTHIYTFSLEIGNS